MAVPISLTNLVNLQNETTAVSAINSNNAALTSALTTALSRTGGAPNQMESQLDMNGNQIINLPSPATANSPARLADINSSITPTPAIISGNNVYTGNNSFTGTTTFGGTSVYTGNTTLGGSTFSAIRPWVDVIAFGADPTGVADSTSSIQAAINALSSTGGMVFVPIGLYKVSSTINIVTSGITIQGTSKEGCRIQSTSTTASIFNITANVNIAIDSLAIQGPFGVVSTGNAGINCVNCQGCKFTNILISDVYVGMSLDTSTNAWVQGCIIENIYGAYGFASVGSNPSIGGGGDYVIGNQFDIQLWGDYNSSTVKGAWATSTSYSINSVVSTTAGWFIASTGGISASSGSGPAVSPFGVPQIDGTVQWLFMSAAQSAGVYLSNSFSNFIAFNDVSGPWQEAFFIINSDGNMINGNTMGQGLGVGIQLAANATNTLIQGNTISGVFGVNANGIADTNGTATGCRVCDNYIQQTGREAIDFQSSNWQISNNYITGAGQKTNDFAIIAETNTNNFSITGNMIAPSAGQTGAILVRTGSSDFYNIVNNIVQLGLVTDSGTGTHKTVAGNH